MISILQARRIFYQHEATVTLKSFRFEHSVTLGLRYRIFFIISVERILNRGHSFSFSPFTADFLLATHWVAFARFSTARPRFNGHITRSRSHFRHRPVSHGFRLEPLPVPSHADYRTTHSSVLPAPLLSVCAIYSGLIPKLRALLCSPVSCLLLEFVFL